MLKMCALLTKKTVCSLRKTLATQQIEHTQYTNREKYTHAPKYVMCGNKNTPLIPLWGLLTSNVGESIPGDGDIFAVEAEVKQSTLPVTVIKLITDVPAQRTKLLSLL